jgi:hypothetical protein
MDTVDDPAFEVGIEDFVLVRVSLRALLQPTLEFSGRRGAVDLGFALAQMRQVRALNKEYLEHPLSSGQRE